MCKEQNMGENTPVCLYQLAEGEEVAFSWRGWKREGGESI